MVRRYILLKFPWMQISQLDVTTNIIACQVREGCDGFDPRRTVIVIENIQPLNTHFYYPRLFIISVRFQQSSSFMFVANISRKNCDHNCSVRCLWKYYGLSPKQYKCIAFQKQDRTLSMTYLLLLPWAKLEWKKFKLYVDSFLDA